MSSSRRPTPNTGDFESRAPDEERGPKSWLEVPSPVQDDGSIALTSRGPAPIPPSEDIELDAEDEAWVKRRFEATKDELLAYVRRRQKR